MSFKKWLIDQIIQYTHSQQKCYTIIYHDCETIGIDTCTPYVVGIYRTKEDQYKGLFEEMKDYYSNDPPNDKYFECFCINGYAGSKNYWTKQQVIDHFEETNHYGVEDGAIFRNECVVLPSVRAFDSK